MTTTTTSTPGTARAVSMRPTAFVVLLVTTILVTAGLTWGLNVAMDDDADTARGPDATTGQEIMAGQAPSAQAYVEGIVDLTPAELAATFGNGPITSISPASEAVVAELAPEQREYVEGVMAMSPAQLAAAFGNVALEED